VPVNAVAPNTAAPPAPETAPPGAGDGAAGAEGEDFDALLGDALADPTAAPTVTLAGMVAALSGQDIDPAAIRPDLTPGAAGGATTAAQRAGGVDGPGGYRPDLADAGAGAAVLRAGEQYLGVPYKWGGTSPTTGFDCSGFVQRAFADIGVSLPRVSIDQAKEGTEVAGGLAGAQPGDLLFWRGSNGRPNHIAIYAGEGQMLEAPSSGKHVHYRDVWRTPDSVRRVL